MAEQLAGEFKDYKENYEAVSFDTKFLQSMLYLTFHFGNWY